MATATATANGTLYYGPGTTYPSDGTISGSVTVLWKEGTWYNVETSTSPKRRGYVSTLTNIIGDPTVFSPTLGTRYTASGIPYNEPTYQGPGNAYKSAGYLGPFETVKFLQGNDSITKINGYAIVEYDLSAGGKKRAWFPYASLSDTTTTLTLAGLKSKFPHGKYWNHVGKTENNQDGCTTSTCASHTSTSSCNAFNPAGTDLAWQCMGFAEKCGYDFTGFNPRNNANGWSTSTSSSALDTLKAGDIVRYVPASQQHSIIVTAVSGDTVTYGDCNGESSNRCGIRWGQTVSKATLKNSFVHLRSAPKTLA